MFADEFEFLYNGQVIDDPANPAFKGQAGFIECRTTPANTDTSEIGRMKVVVKADGINAKLKAQSILMTQSSRTQTHLRCFRRASGATSGSIRPIRSCRIAKTH